MRITMGWRRLGQIDDWTIIDELKLHLLRKVLLARQAVQAELARLQQQDGTP